HVDLRQDAKPFLLQLLSHATVRVLEPEIHGAGHRVARSPLSHEARSPCRSHDLACPRPRPASVRRRDPRKVAGSTRPPAPARPPTASGAGRPCAEPPPCRHGTGSALGCPGSRTAPTPQGSGPCPTWPPAAHRCGRSPPRPAPAP